MAWTRRESVHRHKPAADMSSCCLANTRRQCRRVVRMLTAAIAAGVPIIIPVDVRRASCSDAQITTCFPHCTDLLTAEI